MKQMLALLVGLLSAPVFADEPLPAPEKLTVCSPAGTTCAVSDPATDTTVVSTPASRRPPWTLPGWHRWLFVSDDAVSVVVGHDGMNLLPLDVTLAEPVLRFHQRGRLVRTVTLGDVYASTSQLTRTVSHFAWTTAPCINRANQLVVERMDGTKLAFAMATGQVETPVPDAE